MAAARNTERLQKLALPGVSCHDVDLNWPDNLPALLRGVDTLYYGARHGRRPQLYRPRAARGAQRARRAVGAAGAADYFLSSLQVPEAEQSDHLRARQITGNILRDTGIPVSELRAGIIVGAGSAAFEVMRDMVYNLPVLTPPRWVRSRTSPIALENLLTYLLGLLDFPADENRIFEAAGPEVLSYQQQFERFMRISGRRRPLVPIPFPTR